MIINYDNKIYQSLLTESDKIVCLERRNFIENPYISIHHNIINFYESILKKELNYFKNIYISHLLYKKEYNIYDDKNKELLNKDTLLNKNINQIYLEINKCKENHLFEILLPYIKILIISLFIIIRIDVFLSTTFNNHIKSFEDYYILLLYVLVISICILIPYYSYKVIIRFIKYVIEHLDKDIGMFMSSYIESYNITPYDYNKVNYVDNYINKYSKYILSEEEKEEKEDK